MPPKKTPIVGEPDFTNVSDNRLNDYIDFAQQMIFSFKECDEECASTLEHIWKLLVHEQTERIGEIVDEPINNWTDNTCYHRKIKPVKRLKLK